MILMIIIFLRSGACGIQTGDSYVVTGGWGHTEYKGTKDLPLAQSCLAFQASNCELEDLENGS